MAIDKLTEFSSSNPTTNNNTVGLTLADGFPKSIQPARQWFNYLFNSLTTKINEIIDKKLDLSGGSLTGAINEAASAAIASASTVDLTNATGNFVHITGTTTITAINLIQGASRRVVFDGVLTLTNGANLILPGGANITTAAGDSAIFVGDDLGVVRCIVYSPASGISIQQKQLQSLTASVASNALTVTYAGGVLDFRNATLNNGAPIAAVQIPSNSITVPSGATLGTASGATARLVLLEAYNLGSPVLCIANLSGGLQLNETNLISPTTISSSATSASTIYSASAVSKNSPYRVVGFIDIAEVTAGTWATAPTEVQGAGGLSLASIGSLGVGRTWQDMTSSRVKNTSYTNSSGSPIQVLITLPDTGNGAPVATFLVDGVTILNQAYDSGSNFGSTNISVVIPNGSAYQLNLTSDGTISTWAELR